MNPCTECRIHERVLPRTLCNECYNARKRLQYHERKNPRKQVTIDLKRGCVTVVMPLTDDRAAKLTARIGDWKANGYEVEVKE